jgi:hypothetical protein
MTRTPFDQFSKQFLEQFLSPLGEVQISQEVPGEPRSVDVRFTPATQPDIDPSTLGILGRLAATPCLIEPFRNPPSDTEVKNCLLKLLLVHADLYRQANREEQRVADKDLPHLWVLAPSASAAFLDGLKAEPDVEWLPGVYLLGKTLKTAIVAIHQLPKTEETRWLRLLGKGSVQEQAIAEVLSLPADDPQRAGTLQLLVNWKISLELTGELEQEEQNLMATLSQAYLEWEQQTEQRGIERGIERGERSLILRQLTRRVGELPESVRSHVDHLALPQLEALGEALLDFSNLADLEEWLAELEP